MMLCIGDEVFVGYGTAPARIIALLDNDMAQVEWMMLGKGKWETMYPLTMLHAIGRRRHRTTTKETENEKEKKPGNADQKAASKKKKTSAVAPKRKRVIASSQTSTSRKPQLIQKVTKKPSQADAFMRPTIKPAVAPTGKRSTAKKCTSSSLIDYSQMDPNSVARRHYYSSSDSSSDVQPGAKHDCNSDDNQKPAAKPFITIDESSFSDSSDDELELAKKIKRHAESRLSNDRKVHKPAVKPWKQELLYSSDSSDFDIKLARTKKKPVQGRLLSGRKEHKPAVRPWKQEYSFSCDDSDNESSSCESEVDGKNGEVAHQNSTTDQLQVKQEPIVPQRHVFQPGDYIWVQDGDRHPAELISVLDDTLEIKWTYGFSSKTVMVPKSSATLMFDLTAADDDGRPRRSARARRKPDLLRSPPIKKTAIKQTTQAKKKAGRAAKSQQKKKRRGLVAKPKQVRNVVMYCTSSDSDTSTDMESATDAAERSRFSTFAEDPVILNSSNDESSVAQSVVTEATFEYTAPDVDPKYRSIHVITNLDTFMKMEPWKKEKPVVDQNSFGVQVKETVKQDDAGERVGSDPLRKKSYDVGFSPPPKISRERNSPNVTEGQKDQSTFNSESTLLQDVPSRLQSGSDVIDEQAAADASHTEPRSLLWDNDLEESHDDHRQPTETANPDEIPDILLTGVDEEPATNEDRLIADSQELSRAFAAFGNDCDLNTQPGAMCI